MQAFAGGYITIQVMAFSNMSAPYKNAVNPLLKSQQEMMGRHAGRTHHPDHPDICRVLQSTDPSQVSSRVCSPGTQKAKHGWLKLVVAHARILFSKIYSIANRFLTVMDRCGYWLHTARIWHSICLGLNPFSWTLSDGQVAAQQPQPLHRIVLMVQIFCSGTNSMAS